MSDTGNFTTKLSFSSPNLAIVVDVIRASATVNFVFRKHMSDDKPRHSPTSRDKLGVINN